MSIDPRDLFVSLNPLGLDERELEKDSTGFADNRTHGEYLVFLAGYKAGAADGEERGCQRHRHINAEGCKPESNILPTGLPCADVAPCRSLEKAEGDSPDNNIHPKQHQGEPALWRYRKTPARSWFYTVHKRSAEIAMRDGYIVEGFYTHADPGEVERLRAELERMRERVTPTHKSLIGKHTELIRERDTVRAQLAERDALLRDCFISMLKGGYSKPLRERIKAALSASAEPDCDLCAEGAHEYVPFQSNCVKCSEPYQAAPAPKITPATLMLVMENLAVKALASKYPPFFPPASACQAPLVMLGGVCLRVTYSGLKWYHDQLIDDRWEPLSVDEFEALLADALRGSQGDNL